MSLFRSFSRPAAYTLATAAVLGATALTSSGVASAHVAAEPEQAEKGGHEKVTFRVPNERPNSGTVKVTITLPTAHPLSSVRAKPMPGWDTRVEKVRLPQPVMSHGSPVTEAVRSITWTARPGTRIAPNEFQEFEANFGGLPDNAEQLVMPAEQTYENGEVVKWDMPPPPGGSEEPARPAPVVTLVAGKHGAGHSHGGAEKPKHSAPTTHRASTDNTARVLGGAGLAAGGLGVGIGVGALVRGRRKAGAPEREKTGSGGTAENGSQS